jgi:hypothetical protein
MAESALADLVRHTGLSDGQLSHLRSHPAFPSQLLQNIIEQAQLLREFNSPDMSDDLLNRCLFSSKDSVQRKLLNKPGLPTNNYKPFLNSGQTEPFATWQMTS